MSADHRRLDALLARATVDAAAIDLAPFGEFRAGLIRHIGMEEKVLFPAAGRARGASLPLAARLRVDHGAIVALLVPTPTPVIVARLLSVLGPHDRREEDPGGVYDACDEAVGPVEAERLVDELRRFPAVPVKPYNDGPAVEKHIEETLELSRRQWRAKEPAPAKRRPPRPCSIDPSAPAYWRLLACAASSLTRSDWTIRLKAELIVP